MPPTMRVIDLTHTITPDIPVYPGTEPPTFEPASTYERDGFRETLVTMYTHTGTHIDPPYHLFPDRTRLDEFPADRFVGMALRIDCRGIPEGDPITMDRLRPYGDLIRQADFLLFNTGWDSKWGTPEYFGDYPCIDDEVLDLIIERDYKGIGFDVIGLDPVDDTTLRRHHRLFESCDIINIENLCNLDQCGDGLFRFACLPLKIGDCDGAPARAIAWFDRSLCLHP